MFLARSFSHHSLLSAIAKIPDLVSNAKQKGYTTIALTDEETTSGLIEFYTECEKQGVKAVTGSTLKIPNVAGSGTIFGRNKEFSKIAILPKNLLGYKNLLKLVTIARTIQENPVHHLTLENFREQIQQNTEKNEGKSLLNEENQPNIANFFVLLAGNDHEIVQTMRNGNKTKSETILQKYLEYINAQDILVELAYPTENQNYEETKQINLELMKICEKYSVQYIASPAPRYLETQDEEAFRVVLAIREQKKLDEISLIRDLHLPSKEELTKMYDYAPKACETNNLENQIEIKIRMDFDKHADEAYFPKFALDEGQTPGQRLAWETYLGFLNRFHPETQGLEKWKELFPYEKLAELKEFTANMTPDTSKLLGYPRDYWGKEKSVQDYIQRIEYELEIIIQKGYPEYFLVFGDIMRWCRQNNVVTNTRGSAAGSLVAYLNDINVLDPLVYQVPFERFLNPFRPSPPDIDGDFADDRREEVIKYIREKYGDNKVSQIITFGTMLPRAAVRDVGRVLGISYKKCDRLAKIIPTAPQGRKTTFQWAMETSSELSEAYQKDEESRRIIDICKKIEGNYRHASCHAAGLLITPTVLTDYTSLQWDSEHQIIVAQYDMKICEKVGLVKMDILGIRNLSILGNAIEIAEERRETKIDLLNIDTYDKKSFELLAKGRTMGIFQLSGPAMTRYLIELEPTKVQDLMAMVALYRPGPMASIPEYIARKRDPRKVKYLVPQMEKWMSPSYGIFVYQEDLLMSTIELAGYDWGQADVLRKGMGKKIQAVIDEQHPKFVEGCIKNNIDEKKAEEIWSLMVPFGAYGFNKAHSSSYGMVAYWTAYMKANYPAEFMTAFMTAESNNLDKIAAAIKECRELVIEVKPPDINKSFSNFTIENDRTIRYGLGSVKNLGSDVINFIINERVKNGIFKDMENFLERVSHYQQFNKRNLEALINAGCLDELAGQLV